MSTRIRETCSCGAEFEVEDSDTHTRSELKTIAAEWREGHLHETKPTRPPFSLPYSPGVAS
jgi:hypothetical protein